MGGTHSLTLGNFCFFFPCFGKKKKQAVFFPRKSLHATHSAERRSTSKKRSKTVKNGTFCRISFFSLFFFPAKSCFFFFPGKVYPSLTHSISEGGKKKTASEKKTPFLLTHSKNHKKVQILIFSGQKKQYGTFAHSGNIFLPSENV